MPKGPNILINFEFCLIIQQEFVEAIDIVLNHYNDPHSFEKTSKGVSKTMSTKTIWYSSFSKQLAIVVINFTPAFFEEVKDHVGSLMVPNLL